MWYLVLLMIIGYSLFAGIVLASFNHVHVSGPTQFLILGILALTIGGTIDAILGRSPWEIEVSVAVLIVVLGYGLDALLCKTKAGQLLIRTAKQQCERMLRL